MFILLWINETSRCWLIGDVIEKTTQKNSLLTYYAEREREREREREASEEPRIAVSREAIPVEEHM